MAGRIDLVVALLAEEFDEPRLVIDLLVEDALGHVVGARVASLGHVTDLGPRADGTAFGLQQNFEYVLRRRVVRQFGVRTGRAVREVADVGRQFAAEFEDPREDEFEVRAVFETGVLRYLLVILLAGEIAAEVGVVVVCGELRADGVDELLADFVGVAAALADELLPDSLARITRCDASRGVLLFFVRHSFTLVLRNSISVT